MAQKMYRKLEFGSLEVLEEETSSTTTDADDVNDITPSSSSPPHAANQSKEELTTTPTNGHTSVPSPHPPSSSHTQHFPPSSRRHHRRCPDKSVVVTRDYYGLAETVGGNHSCLVFFTNTSSTLELRDPVIFTRNGYTRIPPDSKVPPNANTYCGFRKPSLALRGTSGVISYEYTRRNGHSKRFAVLWKIPYRVINREENQVRKKLK